MEVLYVHDHKLDLHIDTLLLKAFGNQGVPCDSMSFLTVCDHSFLNGAGSIFAMELWPSASLALTWLHVQSAPRYPSTSEGCACTAVRPFFAFVLRYCSMVATSQQWSPWQCHMSMQHFHSVTQMNKVLLLSNTIENSTSTYSGGTFMQQIRYTTYFFYDSTGGSAMVTRKKIGSKKGAEPLLATELYSVQSRPI